MFNPNEYRSTPFGGNTHTFPLSKKFRDPNAVLNLKTTIRNSSVNWGTNRPANFAYTVESHQVSDLKMVNFDGQPAFPQKLKAIKEVK